MVTHPCINWACDCLTSVIEHKMFAPCCVSPIEHLTVLLLSLNHNTKILPVKSLFSTKMTPHIKYISLCTYTIDKYHKNSVKFMKFYKIVSGFCNGCHMWCLLSYVFIQPNKSKCKQFHNKSRSKNKGYSGEANEQQAPHKKKFNPRQILKNDDRCHKCGESRHMEGFQCSAYKYQGRNCIRFGHFSSLYYKKQESFKNASSRSPKVHQLRCGQVYMPDNSKCGQSGDNTSSSDESFCLQMKLQAKQSDTSVHMQTAKKSSNMWLPKPAVPYK